MSEMRFQCLRCGKRLKIDESNGGRKGRCPKCGALLEMPKVIVWPNDEPVMNDELSGSPLSLDDISIPSVHRRRKKRPSAVKKIASTFVVLVIVVLAVLHFRTRSSAKLEKARAASAGESESRQADAKGQPGTRTIRGRITRLIPGDFSTFDIVALRGGPSTDEERFALDHMMVTIFIEYRGGDLLCKLRQTVKWTEWNSRFPPEMIGTTVTVRGKADEAFGCITLYDCELLTNR